MDRENVVGLCEPFFRRWVALYRKSFDEFDRKVDASVRSVVEGTRPGFVHSLFLHLLEMEYGRRGSPRIVESDHLKWMFVEGKSFNVGIRNKKLKNNYLSYNHQSENQGLLRCTGCFLGWNMETAHVFLGYRQSRGLQPSIIDIALTSESETVNGQWQLDWVHAIWSDDAGFDPVQYVQPDLPDLPRPPLGVRRRRSDRRPGEETGTG